MAEACAQVYFFRWAGKNYQSLRVQKWSPYGLVRNNERLTSPAYSINANGFRNAEVFSKVKPPKTLRVLILGASVMYSGLGGWFPADTKRVGPDETISEYLRALLEADPELSEMRIEVLNASVNFNRVNEIACGYLDEYQFWDPDLIVIGGTANTFPIEPPSESQLLRKNYNVQGWHPWRHDFERQVNKYTALTLFERVLATLEEGSALAGLIRKSAVKVTDLASTLSARFGNRVRGLARTKSVVDVSTSKNKVAELDVSSKEQYEDYARQVCGLYEAIVSCAQKHNQKVFVFWEYYLVQLNELKPFSAAEQILYSNNLRVRPVPSEYLRNTFIARDVVAQGLRESGSIMIDPLEPLKSCADSVFIDYIHYTPEGNRFMAQVICDSIRESAHQVAQRMNFQEGARQ